METPAEPAIDTTPPSWDLLTSVLACPWCGESVEAPSTPWSPTADLDLRCASCGRVSEVRNGIWQAMGDQVAPRTIAQIVNRFAPTALVYERGWRWFSLSLLTRRRFPVAEELGELTTAVAPRPGQIVVDIACSEGLYARHLAGFGPVVLAVDHSLPFLRAAQRRAAASGVTVLPVQAMAERLPLRTDAVDAVVIGGSLNELDDQRQATAEMGRVTRPGGRLFDMSLVHSPSRVGRLFQKLFGPSGIVFFSGAETVELFEKAGFDVGRVRLERLVLRLDGVRRP